MTHENIISRVRKILSNDKKSEDQKEKLTQKTSLR